MRFENDKVHLADYEQAKSGFPNPIDLNTFNFHEAREEADGELDALRAEEADMQDSSLGRGDYASRYEAANVQSFVTRAIAKYEAQRMLIEAEAGPGIAEIEAFLNEQDPTQ